MTVLCPIYDVSTINYQALRPVFILKYKLRQRDKSHVKDIFLSPDCELFKETFCWKSSINSLGRHSVFPLISADLMTSIK